MCLASTQGEIQESLQGEPRKSQRVSSCVAHGCSSIKEDQEYYDTGLEIEFSPGWLYGLREKDDYQGEGMYPRQCFRALQKYGAVPYKFFPYDLRYDEIKPLIAEFREKGIELAQPYKITSYARVYSEEEIKACIYKTKTPVAVCANVTDAFEATGKDGIVRPPSIFRQAAWRTSYEVCWVEICKQQVLLGSTEFLGRVLGR